MKSATSLKTRNLKLKICSFLTRIMDEEWTFGDFYDFLKIRWEEFQQVYKAWDV